MGEKMRKETKIISAILFFLFFGIALGVGMYYAGYAAAPSCAIESHRDISITLRNEISAQQISDNLKNLSSVPHLAGTDQDFEQADWLRQKFLDFGLDDAYIVPYEVLLSYPNWTEPNKIYVLNNETGEVQYSTSGRQTPLYSPEENSPLAAPIFNAYSGIAFPE